MALFGVVGYGLLAQRNHQKLVETKEALFQDALLHRDAILRQLKDRVGMSEERAKYLHAMNIKLREVIENLEHDLGKNAA